MVEQYDKWDSRYQVALFYDMNKSKNSDLLCGQCTQLILDEMEGDEWWIFEEKNNITADVGSWQEFCFEWSEVKWLELRWLAVYREGWQPHVMREPWWTSTGLEFYNKLCARSHPWYSLQNEMMDQELPMCNGHERVHSFKIQIAKLSI